MPKLTSKIKKWFDIPGDEDGAKVQILHLKKGEVQRIEAETSRWLGKSVNDDFVSELEYNPQKQLRKLRIAALIDWKEFYGLDGNPLDCNLKNKELYFTEDPDLGIDPESGDPLPLSVWIDKFRADLADEIKPQEEEAEKN